MNRLNKTESAGVFFNCRFSISEGSILPDYSGMAHKLSGKNLSLSVWWVDFPLKCPICGVVVILACLSVRPVLSQGWS